MKSWTPAFSIAALLLPLAAADCDKFDFTGDHGRDGFDIPMNQTLRVSSWINCTEELAAQTGNRDGARNGTCGFHHYSMGLVVHPEIRFIDADEDLREDIFEVVQKRANRRAVAATNFDPTIVINYTVSHADVAVGDVGYYGFTPNLYCWDGVVSKCDDDDDDDDNDRDDKSGRLVRVCGLQWIDDQQADLSPGRQQYKGTEAFVGTGSPQDTNEEPQPSYESVANQATEHEESSSARSSVSSAALSVAILSSVCYFIA